MSTSNSQAVFLGSSISALPSGESLTPLIITNMPDVCARLRQMMAMQSHSKMNIMTIHTNLEHWILKQQGFTLRMEYFDMNEDMK